MVCVCVCGGGGGGGGVKVLTDKLKGLVHVQYMRIKVVTANNSYIPQTEQHEPEGSVTDLLDVTLSNPLPHPLSPPPFPLLIITVTQYHQRGAGVQCGLVPRSSPPPFREPGNEATESSDGFRGAWLHFRRAVVGVCV